MNRTPFWPPTSEMDLDDEPEPTPDEAVAQAAANFLQYVLERSPSLDHFLNDFRDSFVACVAAINEATEEDPDSPPDDDPGPSIPQRAAVEGPAPRVVRAPTRAAPDLASRSAPVARLVPPKGVAHAPPRLSAKTPSKAKHPPSTAVGDPPTSPPAAIQPPKVGPGVAKPLAPPPKPGKREPDPPCTKDPFSVEGLRRFAETRPFNWHEAFLPAAAGVEPGEGPTATIRQVLAGPHGRLWPRKSTRKDLNGLRRRRLHARHVAAAVGDRPALSILRADLPSVRQLLPLCPSEAARATKMLQRALSRWRKGLPPGLKGITVLPGQAPPPPLPAPLPKKACDSPVSKVRTVQDPSRVGDIMLRCDHLERAAMALVVGCGLRPGEVARLRRSDLLVVDRGHVWPEGSPQGLSDLWVLVRCGPRERGAPRVRPVPAPQWVADVLRAAGIEADKGSQEPIFATRDGKRRVSLQGIARSIARRLEGTELKLRSWTDLRAIWQARAAQHRLPRGVERGTWDLPDTNEWIRDRRCVHLLRLAVGWKRLADPAAPNGQHPTKLRRRAPSHCPADRAEGKTVWRPPHLPASAMPAEPKPAAKVAGQGDTRISLKRPDR